MSRIAYVFVRERLRRRRTTKDFFRFKMIVIFASRMSRRTLIAMMHDELENLGDQLQILLIRRRNNSKN